MRPPYASDAGFNRPTGACLVANLQAGLGSYRGAMHHIGEGGGSRMQEECRRYMSRDERRAYGPGCPPDETLMAPKCLTL